LECNEEDGMCPHGTTDTGCPLCVTPVSFTREQIAFLEDLLVNKGCMQAIYNGRFSDQPEKCYECAHRLEGIVDQIRAMKMAVAI
jgi:hypothetical protein